jgi:hypothetical protein
MCRQQLSCAVFYPIFSLHSAAVWTVTIATGVILVVFVITTRFVTSIFVHPYTDRMALAQSMKDGSAVGIVSVYSVVAEYFLL